MSKPPSANVVSISFAGEASGQLATGKTNVMASDATSKSRVFVMAKTPEEPFVAPISLKM